MVAISTKKAQAAKHRMCIKVRNFSRSRVKFPLSDPNARGSCLEDFLPFAAGLCGKDVAIKTGEITNDGNQQQ
jgi:hypothetical protein